MIKLRTGGVLAALALLSGCATILEGSTQDLALETNPAGATCVVNREGNYLGTVVSTPGHFKIGRSKRDLTIVCTRPGFATVTVSQPSDYAGTTWGNLMLGYPTGFLIDGLSGADYFYPTRIIMDMAPASPSLASTPQRFSTNTPAS